MAFLYPKLTIRKHTYYIRVAVPKRLINIVKKTKYSIFSANKRLSGSFFENVEG